MPILLGSSYSTSRGVSALRDSWTLGAIDAALLNMFKYFAEKDKATG